MKRDIVLTPGWFTIGALMGLFLGMGLATFFYDWVTRQTYDRAKRAEIRAMDLEEELTRERTLQFRGRR